MTKRQALKVMKDGGWLWESDRLAYRMSTFLAAKAVRDRRLRRRVRELRAMGLWPPRAWDGALTS